MVKGCALKLSHPSVRPGFRNSCPLALLRHSLLIKGAGDLKTFMVTLTIDGKKVKAKEGASLLEIIRKMSISIPTLCYHPDLTPQGSCRLCTVEVSQNGKTRMVTACNFPVKERMEVHTHSDRVLQARRVLIELFLARCPGVKLIQDLAMELGVQRSRFHEGNPENKCLLCGLCVRTCSEIVGAHAIGFSQRGTLKKMGPPFEIDPDQCIACGACEFVCPTGAIKMERSRIQKIKLSDTGTRRYCRHMRLGLVDFMVCSSGFECWRCEFDQRMEDRFGTHPAFALKPAQKKKAVQTAGFTFHPEAFYSVEHLWARPLDQLIRMGLDGLVASFAFEAESIHLPSEGSVLKKKEPLAELVAAHRTLTLRAPLSGSVLAVNRDVIKSPDLAWREPYDRGWLIILKPDALEDLGSLYSGEGAKTWFFQQAGQLSKHLKGTMEPTLLREALHRHWDELVQTY